MDKLKKIIGDLIGLVLLVLLKRRALEKYNGHVLSIYFHNPSVFLFKGIVHFLYKNGFHFICEREFYKILEDDIKFNDRKVFISFDDGWRGNLKLIPIIEKYDIPITLFVAVEPVITGNFWWEYTDHLKGTHAEISSDEDLKVIPNKERLAYIKKASSEVQIEKSAINLSELEYLHNHPLITIGSHTYHHPITTMCTAEELHFEYYHSKDTLETWLKSSIQSFSYPNGDYDERDFQFLRENNYKMAFTTCDEVTRNGIHAYEIPRISINSKGGIYENIARMLGVWHQYIMPLQSKFSSKPRRVAVQS